MTFNVFRSKRLLYVPIEDTKEHDDFLLQLRVGTLWANAAPQLPNPGGPENSKKEARDLIANARIPMYICVPAEREDAKMAPEAPDVGQGGRGEEDYTGKGYGTEALEWMLWYGFVMAGLHRMAIGCAGWNKGARRLYERVGFKLEGIEREKLWFMGGWHDFISLGMLRREWLELARARGDGGLSTGEDLDTDAVARLMGCQ